MRVIERKVQKIRPGKWNDVGALERAWDDIEARQGNVPKKRRQLVVYGSTPTGTFIWEREWESMAALEAHWLRQNPPELASEISALQTQSTGVFEEVQTEMIVHYEDIIR